MFFHIDIEQNVDLEPQHFGPNLRKTLAARVTDKVEGTCSGRHGYVVCVTGVTSVSQGKIRSDGSGLATFKVAFGCVTFRPFKGEVLDCVVTSVNKMGFFAEAGPLQVFVSSHVSTALARGGSSARCVHGRAGGQGAPGWGFLSGGRPAGCAPLEGLRASGPRAHTTRHLNTHAINT